MNRCASTVGVSIGASSKLCAKSCGQIGIVLIGNQFIPHFFRQFVQVGINIIQGIVFLEKRFSTFGTESFNARNVIMRRYLQELK